ncbi:hypothetical protein [Microlunatus speluncae]|uniref:hypothetical protein n=1 Tax=Microlunatus speluncae TaxID=2594267 RepID=UPI0012667BB2|nr:hypothetical protein [Microlunatus speluncae]
MQIPAYWLPRPESPLDRETTTAFDRLLEESLERGTGDFIDYRIDAPKWQFLCHVADRSDVVLHGSGDARIERFEPRQPDDPLEFSNRFAVFAATDGIWPIFYAILDRVAQPATQMVNSTVRVGTSDQLGEPHYFFSISESALRERPWRSGTVYLLPADSFERQPPIPIGDAWIQVAQAASPVSMKPVAKIAVSPEDFPFLDQIRGHDDKILAARMAADPGGFPWLEAI